jgi:hypothetical protein
VSSRQTLLKVGWHKIAKGGRKLVECLWQTSLLHYSVGGVTGLNFVIDGKAFAADRALPHFMIALPLPHEVATMRSENLFNFGREIAHQATLARGSE